MKRIAFWSAAFMGVRKVPICCCMTLDRLPQLWSSMSSITIADNYYCRQVHSTRKHTPTRPNAFICPPPVLYAEQDLHSHRYRPFITAEISLQELTHSCEAVGSGPGIQAEAQRAQRAKAETLLERYLALGNSRQEFFELPTPLFRTNDNVFSYMVPGYKVCAPIGLQSCSCYNICLHNDLDRPLWIKLPTMSGDTLCRFISPSVLPMKSVGPKLGTLSPSTECASCTTLRASMTQPMKHVQAACMDSLHCVLLY